jgi:hypothetical protein
VYFFLKNAKFCPQQVISAMSGHVASPTGAFFKKSGNLCPQQVISAMFGHVLSPTVVFLHFLTTFGVFYLFP